MCEDCVGPTVSRRQVLWVPPAALGAALLADAPAYGAQRTVARINRSAWGARPRTSAYVPHQVDRITLHHSAVVLRDNRNAPRQLRAFQADHQSRGWPDIAYHLLIDRHGNVYQGRPCGRPVTPTPATTRGATCSCWRSATSRCNTCPRRSSTRRSTCWPGRARATASRQRAIRGHRAYATTLCPGAQFQRYLKDGTVRRQVARRLGDVGMRDLRGRPGRRRVRRIENGTD